MNDRLAVNDEVVGTCNRHEGKFDANTLYATSQARRFIRQKHLGRKRAKPKTVGESHVSSVQKTETVAVGDVTPS